MSFDGFVVHALTEELSQQLVGGRISKVYQPFEQEIQIVVRNNRKNYRLHASIHSNYYRIHLTKDRPNNPQQAPMFAMLLRKHLERATILSLEQVENDRIIKLEISGRDELGDLQSFYLIFELMGRHSNIILVDPVENKIIDCIKHVPAYMNTYRLLQPGAEYIAPPKNNKQTNLYQLSQTELLQWSKEHAEELRTGKSSAIIQGIGRPGSQAIQYWITQENATPYNAVHQFMENINSPSPTLFKSKDTFRLYAFNLPQIKGQRTSFGTLSELMDVFYGEKVRFDRVRQVSGDLIQRLEHIIDRNNHKLENLASDREIAKSAEIYQINGELLSAYSYQVEKGLSSVELPNYYQNNEPITIELDPRKTAIENSQAYFKKYTKYRDSLKYIDRQLKLTQTENNYLEGILVQINQADIEDLADIKEELDHEGYVPNKNKKAQKKRVKTKSKPRRYQSSDGVMIYVGRNNKQNDDLSMKKAAKNHWWLHTKDIPGAHVIIESDKPSDQTMTEAAEIAAYHSKSQASANVPVDTVQVKKLRKPNGAKPGLVIYEGQNTLYVTPVESKIQSLEINQE